MSAPATFIHPQRRRQVAEDEEEKESEVCPPAPEHEEPIVVPPEEISDDLVRLATAGAKPVVKQSAMQRKYPRRPSFHDDDALPFNDAQVAALLGGTAEDAGEEPRPEWSDIRRMVKDRARTSQPVCCAVCHSPLREQDEPFPVIRDFEYDKYTVASDFVVCSVGCSKRYLIDRSDTLPHINLLHTQLAQVEVLGDKSFVPPSTRPEYSLPQLRVDGRNVFLRGTPGHYRNLERAPFVAERFAVQVDERVPRRVAPQEPTPLMDPASSLATPGCKVASSPAMSAVAFTPGPPGTTTTFPAEATGGGAYSHTVAVSATHHLPAGASIANFEGTLSRTRILGSGGGGGVLPQPPPPSIPW